MDAGGGSKRKAKDDPSPPRPPLGAGGDSPPRLSLGAKRRRQRKRGPGRAVVERPQPPLSAFPAFPDSDIQLDYSVFPGLVSGVYDQKRETCGSVAFCRLLQAFHNRNLDVKSHRFFSIEDLSDSLKKKTGKFSITNINHALKLIINPGLLTFYPDREKQPDRVHGHRIGGYFSLEKQASRDRVFELIEEGPIAIAIEATETFKRLSLSDGIYAVPLDRVDPENSDHALVVYGWGRCTRTGREFLVVQNSWGVNWGNLGYGRLYLDPQGKFGVFRATGIE